MQNTSLISLIRKITKHAMALALSGALFAQAAPEKPVTPEKPATVEKPIVAPEKKVKRTMKLADDSEESGPPEKDPKEYQLSNKKLIEAYTVLDRQPYDRGEHFMISGFMGGIGGAVVGGMIGLTQFTSKDTDASITSLTTYGGIGAGVGVVAGITVAFFERGKIEQFAIGKFLLKYSWYGAIGGGLLGAGVGFIPYSKSSDYGDILKFAGYGSAIGLLAGLTLFVIDLPDHLKLYSYRREDQNVIMLSLSF